MRATMLALLAAVVLAVAPQASAQSAEEQQGFLRWAQQFHTLVVGVTQPLSGMPQVDLNWGAGERRAWVREARQWSVSYRGTVAQTRARWSAVSPPPLSASPLRDQYERQAAAMPILLDGLDQLMARYDEAIDAVERNRPQALIDAALASTDAQAVILTQFRDTNQMQAASIADLHPQKYLLVSFTESYNGSIAVVELRRAELMNDMSGRAEIAARVRASANAMIAAAERGRDSVPTFSALIRATPGIPNPERYLAAVDTYYGSFNREDLIASEFASIASLLESGRPMSEIGAEIDQHAGNAGRLDLERAADIQRRISMLQ